MRIKKAVAVAVAVGLVTGVTKTGLGPAASPTVAYAGDSGTVTGVVLFPQAYPEQEKTPVTKDRRVCGAFQYSEEFVVSEKNHGLKNVVVSLTNITGGAASPSESVVQLAQKKCRYVPHVQAVQVGTTLELLNDDGILHNVHAYYGGLGPQNTIFNKAQPKFLKKIQQKLDKPGIYFFRCDVHAHMTAYIAVMEHPYYAVTDENGEFTISEVPPGRYKIQAWHEVLGTQEKEVTVQAGKAASVRFEIWPNE